MKTDKKRIVFGLNDFLVGGMQQQFLRQAEHFNHAKFDITLVTLFQFPGRADLYAQLPKQVSVHQLSFGGWWDVPEWYRLYRLMKQLQPDLVVSSLFFSNTIFRLLKPLVGYVSIAREHNTYTDKSTFHIWIDRFLSRLSFCIVAVSRTVALFTAAQEHIALKHFEVIHNGIDLANARNKLAALPDKNAVRQEIGLAPGDQVVINVARLAPQKNHKLLIEGFSIFAGHDPSRKLLLVGEGGERAALEKLVRDKGLESRVFFSGMQKDVWRFYKAADIFASTSSVEGFSNAYLEALAAGLPIVSTLTAGTDEFLVDGHNGFVVQESTAHAVADALTRAAGANMQELRVHSEETAERFSLTHTVEQYERLFERSLHA